MATLAQLRTRILSKLDDGDIQHPTTAQATEQINLSIEFYEAAPFWFNEAISDQTAVVGDPILPSPSDFLQIKEPNGLVVKVNQVRYPLLKITPLEYDTINTEGRGLPRWYTFRENQFELYYYPDQAYSIAVYYQKSYADLVADGDSNDFTNFAERLIEYKTLADLLRDYRSDYERAAVYDARIKVEFNEIKTETYHKSATGNLVTENIVDSGAYGFYYGY